MKVTNENLYFLIDIATIVIVAEDKKTLKEEPKSFNEVWYHPDKEPQKEWYEATRKEFEDMIKQQVWQKMSKSIIPLNCSCMKCKWVFKIKHNGSCHTRLAACEYS